MKKILLMAALMACVGAMAQGTVLFKNNVAAAGLSAPVFDSDGVTKLTGNAYYAQLYADIGGSFTPVGTATAFAFNGFVSGGQVTIPAAGIVAGKVTLQMRAWEATTAGTAGTYEAALAGSKKVGISETFSLVPGNPNDSPPGVAANLVGLKSFSISGGSVIPEPSTIALGMIGAAALLLRRRK
jgi:hypothetical protein